MRIAASETRLAPPAATANETPRATVGSARALPNEPSPFAQLLHGIGGELTRGEATLHHALHAARDLGPAELIALQASVYRYSETIDLASHLVDRITNGVKTVIQGNGQ